MWTAVKIVGAVCAVLLCLVFVLILVLTTRPAVLTGVGGSDLGRSVSESDAATPCSKGSDGNWNCPRETNLGVARYRVDVDWMGCWKADRVAGPDTRLSPSEKSGCIELGDLIVFD